MKSKSLKITNDICLVPPHPEMAEEMFRIIDEDREYLREWLPFVDGTKVVEDTRNYLKSAAQWNIGGQQWNVVIRYKNHICGCIGYPRLDKQNNRGEIGYWLSEKYQGKGIMIRSCERAVRYGFEHLDLNRIEIRVATPNVKSIAIPRKLGFEEEGVQREAIFLNGRYYDALAFSKLKREFDAEQKK